MSQPARRRKEPHMLEFAGFWIALAPGAAVFLMILGGAVILRAMERPPHD